MSDEGTAATRGEGTATTRGEELRLRVVRRNRSYPW